MYQATKLDSRLHSLYYHLSFIVDFPLFKCWRMLCLTPDLEFSSVKLLWQKSTSQSGRRGELRRYIDCHPSCLPEWNLHIKSTFMSRRMTTWTPNGILTELGSCPLEVPIIFKHWHCEPKPVQIQSSSTLHSNKDGVHMAPMGFYLKLCAVDLHFPASDLPNSKNWNHHRPQLSCMITRTKYTEPNSTNTSNSPNPKPYIPLNNSQLSTPRTTLPQQFAK